MADQDYSHLQIIETFADIKAFDFIPDPVWIFDLDKHGWWWGNQEAIKFWELETVEDLINKDLSGDTEGARARTQQTFDLAVEQGLTIDPWTTYPDGKPKTLFMKHRAVLLGPERHRGIIAFISEEVNLGEQPENLLLVEAMRYTTVIVTSFTLEGKRVVENPAATEAYKHIHAEDLSEGSSEFAARFADPEEGKACLKQALSEKGGRWEYRMRTGAGTRIHALDIRMTRHPLSGDFLLLMAEHDVTPLKNALDEAHKAHAELEMLAHYDALTGLASLHLFQENLQAFMTMAARRNEKMAVMFIDLDGFKQVNDELGHMAGDKVLVEVARRLKDRVRRSDLVARIGGDEFILLQTKVTDVRDCELLAGKIVHDIGQPFFIEDQTVTIGASIGISLFPDHGADAGSLIHKADQSMYQVKKAGKNNYRIA